MNDPERIWLEPGEGFYPTFGRTWCPADDWEGEGIEYIRADLAAAHTRAAVEQERADCEAAIDKLIAQSHKVMRETSTGDELHKAACIEALALSCARTVVAARKAQP